MVTVAVPASVYRRLIDKWTTPLERLRFSSGGKHLPGGTIRFLLDDSLAEAIRELMLPGESFADAIDRLTASRH